MDVVIGDTLYCIDPDSTVQDTINNLQTEYNDIGLKLVYDGQTLDNELTWGENEILPLGVELEIQHSREFTKRCNKILFDEIYGDTEFNLKKYIKRGEFENFHLVYAKYETCLPIHMYLNNIPLLKLLIEVGADVNARDNIGLTALIYAYDLEQLRLLIKAGADVNIQDKYGRTALMLAENTEKIKLLIEAGADVNAQDEYGRTALMLVKNEEQTKRLIKAGADVNIQDKYGRTALMHAKNEEQFDILIEAGADVNIQDKWGQTGLMYAKNK